MHIKVKVITEAKKVRIEKTLKGNFLIAVREKAKKNSANKAVLNILASHFGTKINKFKIIKGHHAPSKIVEYLDSQS